MKIKAVDVKTKKPVQNKKIQLQVKGKDSGYVSCETDDEGNFKLDDKYKNQQIADSIVGDFVTAADGVTVNIDKDKMKDKEVSKEKEKSWEK